MQAELSDINENFNGKTIFHFQVLSCLQMEGKSNCNGYFAKIWTHQKVAFFHLFMFTCYRIEPKKPHFLIDVIVIKSIFLCNKNFVNITIYSSTTLQSFWVEVKIHRTCHFIWVSNSVWYWGDTTCTHTTHECVSACTHVLLIHQTAIWHLDMKHVIML